MIVVVVVFSVVLASYRCPCRVFVEIVVNSCHVLLICVLLVLAVARCCSKLFLRQSLHA